MSDITQLTPEELKEIQKFLKERNIDVQIRFSPQKVRRMEDGGLVIDPPQFTTGFVKVKPQKEIKGNGGIETS